MSKKTIYHGSEFVIEKPEYGKGNVQKTISLLDGSSIKFTVESWLTSKGQSVNAIGIVPDIMEEQNPTYYVDYTDDADSQLQMAISLLK